MQATEDIPDEVVRLHHPPRRKKLVALSGLIIVIVVPITLLAILRSEFARTPLPIGQPAPRLELTSLTDQVRMQFGAIKDAKQILLFFTIECPHCQRELLNFEALYRRYNTCANFVAISLSDPTETQEILRSRGFSFPIACDVDRKARNDYRIRSIPALFWLMKKGS